MHHLKVLEQFGCTEERLREIFTAEMSAETPAQVSQDANEPPPESAKDAQASTKKEKDGARRRRWESKIRSRIYDGIRANLRSARPNQAVDMAWDAPPIQRHMIPLMMWATGKIKLEDAYANCVASSGQEQADKFFRKSSSNGKEVLQLNQHRITDISIDILKSYVTRRHAAMDALWSNLWPLFKYDPRGTDDVAMLRADVLSQRVDVISDAYNYRHFFSQCRRQMLLYGWSVAFPRARWDRKVSWRQAPTNTGEPSNEVESYVTREGVDFVNPHPSRIYADQSRPLANLNSDTGPSFIGYWDIVRWGSLLGPSEQFFNLDHVYMTDDWRGMTAQFPDFFTYYFDPCVMNFPECNTIDPSASNDRLGSIGRYSSTARDHGVMINHYFEQINPKVEGIGTYDADVWLHLIVAGDCTVIGGEFLPSIPGIYGGVNCNDGRLANGSMGAALLGYQDHASNIMSSMLMQLRTSLIQLWLIDKDSLEPEIVKSFKENANDSDWWVDRKVLIYSATKLRDLGIQDPSSAFKVVQAQVQNVFQTGLQALNQLLNLADRLLILSPNELGQPNPREVSAREVSDIATSVQSIYAFINQGPREMVAAAKELIYDSLISCGSQSFRVPVTKRYTRDVVKRAGLEIPTDIKLQDGDDIIPLNTPVMGNLRSLVYDYYFDSRDGSERVQNTQGAQVVMQLLQSILQVPALAQKMGFRNIADAANIVIRMSGAPWNFQFETPQGGSDELPQPEPAAPAAPAAPQAAPAEDPNMRLQKIELMLMQLMQGLSGQAAPAEAPPTGNPSQRLQDIAA